MANKKVYVSAGHNERDTGAVGFVTESIEVRKIADEVAKSLKRKFEVTTYRDTFDMSVWDTINEANAKNVDLFVEFHENACGGNGAEVIIHNKNNQDIADAFRKHFANLGQEWRRTIIDPEFWVLRDTNARSAIVEVAFVDNWEDIKDFDSDAEKRKLADEMAEAIGDILKLPRKKPANPHPWDITVKVQKVRIGDDTPSARIVMDSLSRRGFYTNHPPVNGKSVFTVKASNALKRLQKKYGLAQTGECDETTWPYILGSKK